jgi:acyl carrier protein
MAELERVFNTPVIEAYGMTETPFPVTSNPLPPGKRKPGSVGIVAGPEVAIMDEAGRLVPTGIAGDVVVRGSNVMRGYAEDTTANSVAFRNGWFRSGDHGYFDSDGYLFLTGRIKEIINRGGEKISPREVEEVLLDHPAVAQAVAFSVPHVSLGEDILAAVSLRKTFLATESELRHFMVGRLASFKVPRQILILSELPKGPSGKLQRSLLAESFGFRARSNAGRPEQTGRENDQALKQDVAQIWAEVLGLTSVGAQDNFFELGGDSIKLTRVVSRLQHQLAREIPLRLLFEYPTLADFAEQIKTTFLQSPETRPISRAGQNMINILEGTARP